MKNWTVIHWAFAAAAAFAGLRYYRGEPVVPQEIKNLLPEGNPNYGGGGCGCGS